MHAEQQRLETAINVLLEAGADKLLCTGDLCDGPGDLERCVELLKEHQVLCVRGNHDRWMLDDRVRHITDAHQREDVSDKVLDYLRTLPTQITVDTTLGKLLLCHGVLDNDLAKVWPGSDRMPPERSKGLDKLVKLGSHQLMVNGHMHYRIVLDFPGLIHINAGTLSPRHRPGVTALDCVANTIEVFEFGETETSLQATKTEALDCSSRYQWASTEAFDSPKEPERQPLALYS